MKVFDASLLASLSGTVSSEPLGLSIHNLPHLREVLLPDLMSESLAFEDSKKFELVRVLKDLCESLCILPARFPDGFKDIPAWDLSLSSDAEALSFLKDCNAAFLAPPAFMSSKDSAVNFALRIYSIALKAELRGPIFLYHPQPGPNSKEMGVFNTTADWIKVINASTVDVLLKSKWTRPHVLGSTQPRS